MAFQTVSDITLPERLGFHAFLRCQGCGGGVIVWYGRSDQTNESPSYAGCQGDAEMMGFQFRHIWPEVEELVAPEHTPEKIARVFIQALNALKRGEFDAAGGMARKTIDVATREIESSFTKSDTLAFRINKLHKAGKLTDQLREWAHVIREDGNDAAHDPDLFTEEEAVQICEFAETFLEYVFTMPGKLEARKIKKAVAEA